MSLTLRTVKGAPLTNSEVDGNFTYLDQKIDSETQVLDQKIDSEALILDQKIDNEVAGVRTIALNAEDSAAAAQLAAETAQDSAQAAQAGAQAAQTAAEQARDDAVAVVYSNEASLTPAPGKIPVARSDGTIDPGWLPDQLMMRPNRIDEDVIIPDGYNAFFIDPVEFGPNVTVTGLGNSPLRGV